MTESRESGSKNLKLMMANMYPSKEKLQGNLKEKIQENASENIPVSSSYAWNDNKVLVTTVLLGIVFFIVSLPGFYQTTGNTLGIIKVEDFGKIFSIKSTVLHTIIFLLIAFILIKILNSI